MQNDAVSLFSLGFSARQAYADLWLGQESLMGVRTTNILCFAALFASLAPMQSALGQSSNRPQATEIDEQVLKSAGIPTDNDGLVRFFQLRSLKEGDQKQLEELVNKLSSDTYKDREHATKELLLRGALALKVLKEVKADASVETKRRVETLIKKIDGGAAGPEAA